MSSGRFRSLSEKEHEHFFYKHELSLIARKLSINYFSFHRFAQISRMIEKISKTPLVMAEVYRPDVLSFRPVLKSELLHSP